jgi:hypothetical protein
MITAEGIITMGSSTTLVLLFGLVFLFEMPSRAGAQTPAQPPQPGEELRLQSQTPKSQASAAKTGKAGAPFDLTGYWVAVIDEDWRWRMITPEKGDFSGIPLNLEGRRAADTWNPASDEKTGNQCRVYGAPSLMRLPTRLHITWADDNTLRIETDYGTQTRLLHFYETPSSGERSWQGTSLAEWEVGPAPKGHDAPSGPRDLKVTTTNLRAGYLRRNGIPYSQDAQLTEYFDLIPKQPNGDEWLVVNSLVTDPRYLTERFIVSSNFKKEPDGSKWHPTPCSSR